MGGGPKASRPEDYATLDSLYQSIRNKLALWRDVLPAAAPPLERSERWGMSGACEKRIGGLYTLQQEPDRAAEAHRKARDYYRHAIEIDPVNHWVITQYLSLCSILAEPKDRQGLVHAHHDWWVAARQIASWRLRTGSNKDLAWAHGTLAELEMLGVVFGGADVTPGETQRRIVEYCHKIRDLAGDESFSVRSTLRQFQRYLDWWKRDEWNSLAQAAVDALAEGASSTGRAW